MPSSYQIDKALSQKLGRVAVLMGGTSAEREVSLKSGQAMLDALLKAGVEAIGIDYHGGIQQITDHEFDRACIALHGRGGEDGSIQGLFESMNIPYTGSGIVGSAIAMDKCRSKFIWQGMQLPTPRFGYVEQADSKLLLQLVSLIGFPMAVKPVREGSSFGISKVSNQSQLESAIHEALKYDERVLLEKWIEGEEYTVSILAEEALPAIGLKTDHTFYDYAAKYESSDTRYLLPSGLKEHEELSLGKLSLTAFHALGCSGWGRVDLMRDNNGRFWLLEANTVPGMTDHSLVPMAAKQKGMSFEELVVSIVCTSLGERVLGAEVIDHE